MTNQEILQKAVEKALERGWGIFQDYKYRNMKSMKYKVLSPLSSSMYLSAIFEYRNTDAFDADYSKEYRWSVNDILFDTHFAKAFWGEEWIPNELVYKSAVNYIWQYHLQQMVLEENPLNYLEKYL